MTLEQLLQAVIDKNYPEDFEMNFGLCTNVFHLCSWKDNARLVRTLGALYPESPNYPLGVDEYYDGPVNRYSSGLRAELAQKILNYLKENNV